MKSPVLQFSTITLSLALALQLPFAGAAEPVSEVQKRQTKTVSAGNTKTATAPSASAQQSAAAGQKLFSQAELDQMLAPVALYPDTVLSHVLIAATYPLEIVKATRWLSTQKGMTSEQALKAAENEPWDPSVRALVAFAPLLTKMNNELEWTQKLGDAFLVQQQQVMATVQSLREKAYAAGNLQNQEHITVQRREKEKVIIIEPRQREVVYVPVYDTRVVYGDWWWREYPPIHWPHPGYGNHSSVVYWGSGARVSTGFYFSTFYWPRREVVVINHYNRPSRYYRYDDIIRHEERRHWQHNPRHRHGVVYHTSYQPSREQSGNDYRQQDMGERRRWAAEQRQQQNVSLPGDQQIEQQYPVREQSGGQQDQVRPEVPDDFERVQRDREMMRERGNTPPVIERQPDMPAEQTNGNGINTTEQSGNTMQNPADLELTPMPRENDGAGQNRERPELGEGRDRITPKPGFEQDPAPLPEPMPESINNRDSGAIPQQDSGFGTVVETPRDTIGTSTELNREIPAESEQRERNEIFKQSEPVYQQPEPVYQQPEPVYQQPEPVYQQPEPVYQQPEPVYQQPEPVYQQPEPVYQQPEPVYQQPEPVYQQPEPVYQQPEPVYQQPEPVYQQPEPVYQQPAPVEQQHERPIESNRHIE